MPRPLFPALIAVLLLGGCATPQELRQGDEAQCQGYGFKPGTNDFALCLQRESLARRYAVPAPPYWGPGWWGGPPYPPWP